MSRHWILREPAFALGLPVYVTAAIAFPLHLGWTAASWLAFASYLVIAAGLLSVADAIHRPWNYPGWLALVPQAMLSLLALAMPAALAFWIGTIAGPVDEVMDEGVCASQGAGEADTAAAESDDTFDVTPDCVVAG